MHKPQGAPAGRRGYLSTEVPPCAEPPPRPTTVFGLPEALTVPRATSEACALRRDPTLVLGEGQGQHTCVSSMH